MFNDLRISRRLNFGERVSMDLIADMFNIANKYNVADVNPLFTSGGTSYSSVRSTPVPVCAEAELVGILRGGVSRVAGEAALGTSPWLFA